MKIHFCKFLSLLSPALLLPGLALAAVAPAPQHNIGLLKASASDQVPGQLVAGEASKIDIDRAPVSVSWTLPNGQKLKAQPQPFERVSRSYMINASGSELERGVAVPLSASGATLRISPQDHASAPLSAAQVQITTGGHRRSAAEVSRVMAAGPALAQVGMPVHRGSVAMQLDRNIAGTIHVNASGARGHYVLQVREPDSPFALALKADHDTRLAGQSLSLRARLKQPANSARLDAVSGVLEAPDGWSTDIQFTPQPDRSYLASVTPPAAHAGQRGLWQVHVFASGHDGQQELLRDASNAFAAVRPTARLNGTLFRRANAPGQDVSFDVGVTTATASRYAVGAVLYGHDAAGALQPAVYAQSADWLQPGDQRHITLRFAAADIAKSGLHAPFELHDLRLDDQIQLGLLERRQIAARGIPAHD